MKNSENDLRVLVIGAGPIVIGQATEFDYSGTQACKVLREMGAYTVLINSNPATIQTDFDTADKVNTDGVQSSTISVFSSTMIFSAFSQLIVLMNTLSAVSKSV